MIEQLSLSLDIVFTAIQGWFLYLALALGIPRGVLGLPEEHGLLDLTREVSYDALKQDLKNVQTSFQPMYENLDSLSSTGYLSSFCVYLNHWSTFD